MQPAHKIYHNFKGLLYTDIELVTHSDNTESYQVVVRSKIHVNRQFDIGPLFSTTFTVYEMLNDRDVNKSLIAKVGKYNGQ